MFTLILRIIKSIKTKTKKERKMDVYECILTRRSIRKYKPMPVEFEKIGYILEAGKAAPSSGNLQDWKFILVTDAGTRKLIAAACLQQHWMADAPIHIVVCAEIEKNKQFYGIRGERLYTIQNNAAAIQNMLLMAHAQGLGTCWVGAFEEDMLKQAVGIPDKARPQAIITIGYADEIVPAPMEYPIENIVYIEKFGNKMKNVNDYAGYYSDYVQKGIKSGMNILKKLKDKIQKVE